MWGIVYVSLKADLSPTAVLAKNDKSLWIFLHSFLDNFQKSNYFYIFTENSSISAGGRNEVC